LTPGGVAVELNLTHVGCMAHLRRRFFEAIKALPKPEQKTFSAAHEGVRRIDELYTIERERKALPDDERQRVRREKALPKLKSLHAWPEDLVRHTLPSGKLGDAIEYLLRQWPKLVRYIDDPRLAIDTNLAENAIRQGGPGECRALQPGVHRPGQRARALCVPVPAVCRAAERHDRRGDRGAAAVQLDSG